MMLQRKCKKIMKESRPEMKERYNILDPKSLDTNVIHVSQLSAFVFPTL